MAAPDLQVSEESRRVLAPYEVLRARDPRRIQLFSFLVDAIDDPNHVPFELDNEGLRWTWLEHIVVVWRLDHPRSEIDVIRIWDRAPGWHI